MNLFDLFVKVGLDDQASKEIPNIGKKIKNGLAKAAKIGTAAVAATGVAVAALTRELIKNASEVAEYGDNIDKMSQKMGISAEAYQEWDFVMQHSGTSMEALKAGMKTLANAVDSGNKAFERLGITQEQIANMNQEELFAATIEGLQNVSNETERTYLAGQLLGRGATELGALLNMSAEETSAMREEVHELGGVMSNDSVKAAAAFQDSLQNMQVSLQGTKNSLMEDFLPAITSVMDGFSAVFSGQEGAEEKAGQGISNFISTLIESIPSIIETGVTIANALFASIAPNAKDFAQAGVSAISSLIQGLLKALPVVVGIAGDIILGLVDGILSNLPALIKSVGAAIVDSAPKIFEAVIGIVESLAANIGTIIDMLIEVIPEITEGVSEAIVDNFPALLKGVIALVVALIDNLPRLVLMLTEQIGPIVATIVQVLIENFPTILGGVVQIVFSLIKALPDILLGVWEALAGWISTAVKNIAAKGPEIKAGFKEAFADAYEGVKEAWASVVEWGKETWAKVRNWFSAKFTPMKNLGRDIINGLWSGLKDVWRKVSNWFTNAWDTVTSKVRKILGIMSPSRVYKKIGEYVALGYGEGFLSAFADVEKDMLGAIDGMDDMIGYSEYEISGIDGGRRFGGVNVTQNIYAERMTPSQAFFEARAMQERAVFMGV